MDYQRLIEQMDPTIHESLKRAVELGKWPNGERLTDEQRRTCMQAVIAYEAHHLPEEERTGYIASAACPSTQAANTESVQWQDASPGTNGSH